MPRSESSLQSPEELLALPPEELESALAALVAAGAEGANLLLELEARAADRAARKQIRRAIHVLRSRGVEIAPARRKGQGSVLRPLQRPVEQGIVTPVDPLGRRVLFLLVPARGGVDLHEIAVSDRDGLLGLQSRSGRRRDARAFLRELRGSDQTRSVEVAGAEVRALLSKAVDATPDLPARIDPALVEELREGAGVTPGERLHKERDAAELGTALLERSIDKLVEAGRLAPWPLRGEALEELARELLEIERSPLVLSELQKRERRAAAQLEAARTLFDAATLELYASRLEETAVFLDAEADEEGTRALLALAERVRGAAEAPLEIGFLRRALELSLRIAGERLEEEQKGKLIVPG